MTRLLVIALAVTLILAGCTDAPQTRRIDGWQTTVDQGW